MFDSVPAVAARLCQPKELGPPHLKVVEVGFLKPQTRAPGARTVEQDKTLPAGVLSGGDWE
jgi:hypothetical protein